MSRQKLQLPRTCSGRWVTSASPPKRDHERSRGSNQLTT